MQSDAIKKFYKIKNTVLDSGSIEIHFNSRFPLKMNAKLCIACIL